MPRTGWLGLLRHRDFRLLWAGETVSQFGSAVTTLALPLIAVRYLHVSTLEVGILTAVSWLPMLVIGLPAGAWVDRHRRRPILLACSLASAAVLGSIPAAAAVNALTYAQLVIAAVVTSGLGVFGQVAFISYLPSIVARDDLIEGNAKLQGSQSAAQIAGPGAGGVLVQALGAPLAILADAASFLVSSAALLAIRSPEPMPSATATPNMRNEIVEGLQFVWRIPTLRTLLAAAALANLFLTAFDALQVVFLVRTVELPSGAVGGLLAIGTAGGVLGAFLARRVATAVGSTRAMWLAIVISCPFGLLVPLTGSGARVVFFAIGTFVLMVGIVIYNVTMVSFRQALCPPDLLGRVTATMRVVALAAMPLGGVLGGALGQALGTRAALWIIMSANLLPAGWLLATLRHAPPELPEQAMTGRD